ncbi:hypothetical protein [Streptomyces sp. NPDC000410]|uniref:hypothetical protein n=1 Tax=Streptomyces sp. NPDC000410 TaxID=3154254 RepID=UPI0033317585
MKRQIATAAATAIVGLAGVGIATAPAQAAEQSTTTRVGVNGGISCIELSAGSNLLARGCFDPNGDKFGAADHEADGLRTVVKWETNYGRSGECHAAGGAGTTKTCNYDMREDKKVRFKLILRDGANGPDKVSTSWSPWESIGA